VSTVPATGEEVTRAGDARGASARVPRRRRRSLRARLWNSPWAIRVVTLTVFLGAWEAYGRAQETTASFAPATAVAESLVELVQDGAFWSAFGGTVSTFFVGLGLAIAGGVPLGLVMGRFELVGRFLDVYMKGLLTLPMSTLVPVVVITVGIGYSARVAVVFLFAFVDIAMNSYLGMRYPSRSQVDMARSFGASEWQVLRRILVPGALPSIFVGIRLGTGRALIGMVVSELLLVAVGVGLLINQFQARFEAANLLAITLIILLFGLAMMTLVQWIERRVLHWRQEVR
jgi:NitT/TauT family transport system permease protein